MRLLDTIVAISTPIGRGGLGVVRISGPSARDITLTMVRFARPVDWKPFTTQLAYLLDADNETVDQVVVGFYAAPRSYTAEDLIEISCHGSLAVLRHCVEQAVRNGARPAEPGEFTFRAFLNGRIDLPQAEAVRDLIESTTLYQAKIALQQVEGSVSKRIKPTKEKLLELISLLEAGIDFADNDIDVAPDAEILGRIGPIRDALASLHKSYGYGKLVHDGFTLAIAGKPNVGKSSLFNRLLEQDRAIVSDIAGTTRDTVSETASLGGIPVRFVDTAGIRVGQDLVESLGIERSVQAMADADLTIVVLDGSAPLDQADQDVLGRGASLVVANKSDRGLAAELPPDAIVVSALTGEGIDELRRRILASVSPESGIEREVGFITSIRHERLLGEAIEALDKARVAINEQIPHEMLLLDLYCALQPVDAITGATTADDILNRIFATFCIGK